MDVSSYLQGRVFVLQSNPSSGCGFPPYRVLPRRSIDGPWLLLFLAASLQTTFTLQPPPCSRTSLNTHVEIVTRGGVDKSRLAANQWALLAFKEEKWEVDPFSAATTTTSPIYETTCTKSFAEIVLYIKICRRIDVLMRFPGKRRNADAPDRHVNTHLPTWIVFFFCRIPLSS